MVANVGGFLPCSCRSTVPTDRFTRQRLHPSPSGPVRVHAAATFAQVHRPPPNLSCLLEPGGARGGEGFMWWDMSAGAPRQEGIRRLFPARDNGGVVSYAVVAEEELTISLATSSCLVSPQPPQSAVMRRWGFSVLTSISSCCLPVVVAGSWRWG
jgi:hypothetical protein